MNPKSRHISLFIVSALSSGLAQGVEPGEPMLPAVVVTATRVEQSSFDLPASIDRVGAEAIREMQLQVNLSESLTRVPGVVVQNRQNHAQDLQISARGFGARSTFGVRGLRLYADNIPATMPDGQGQVSHFDLGSAGRIEVLRGPFSALYGNSSGGVISLFTENGKPGAALEGSAAYGSHNTRRTGLKTSGDTGALNYVLSGAHLETDGYRQHSAARRTNYNAKLQGAPDAASTLSLVINSVDMPEAQDPLGLDRRQFEYDPRQAGSNARLFNTRKSVSQTQAGVTYTRELSRGRTLAATMYAGERLSRQFQAISAAAQSSASSPGGLINLERDYRGGDLRWTGLVDLADMPLRITAGLAYETMDEWRRGFQNFTGLPGSPAALGIAGALRRDEDNRTETSDQYVQLDWEPATKWRLLAGLRHSTVKFKSSDKYLSNGDDSGTKRFSSTNPVLGLTFRATDDLNVYASYGRGFETPTLNELSYRSSAPGLNFGLSPAKSDHLEAGVKARLGAGMLASLAAFQVKTRDEIAVLTNSGGRSVFQNVGGTTREGVELAVDARLPMGFGAYVAYSTIDARYKDDFQTCVGSPCFVPNTPVSSGNAIPGIPRATLYADLTWKHAAAGFESGLEMRRSSKIYVNDVNDDAAPAYTVTNLRFGFTQQLGHWRFREFIRVDNVADRKYAGSIIVNEGNRRYFEPAPGRSFLVGLSTSYSW